MQDRFRFRVIDNRKDSDTYGKMFYRAEYAYDYISEVPAECFGDLVDCENEDWIVEQCTGLKDKNGKLIYEGDFLKDHNGIWQVLWDEKEAAFYLYNKKRDFYLSPFIGEFEVIGNIHENADLLGEE